MCQDQGDSLITPANKSTNFDGLRWKSSHNLSHFVILACHVNRKSLMLRASSGQTESNQESMPLSQGETAPGSRGQRSAGGPGTLARRQSHRGSRCRWSAPISIFRSPFEHPLPGKCRHRSAAALVLRLTVSIAKTSSLKNHHRCSGNFSFPLDPYDPDPLSARAHGARRIYSNKTPCCGRT